MSWTKETRGRLAALAVCVLLPLGTAGCGTAHGGTGPGPGGGASAGAAAAGAPSPVGKVLDDTDDSGRPLREVGGKDAPGVGVEVTPDSADGWDVRLTFRHFRVSAPGAHPTAVTGRGPACLFVDGRRIARLYTPRYRLPARLVPHGTHHVTARLYADDGTVWAVHGKPVQSTADITVSGTRPPGPTPGSADRLPDG
ncbi:hypothetical protein GTY81_00405 [Streptomyces sp. SID8366]|uniref:hypothetical protein n=2 Tax=Streptomyces TaxID=1883 RepID=UPI000DB99097|nr:MULTISPECIES: hypothetical protein [Streptomyces]MYU02383.1 hypothetical protein [Streptomyces sp. SID8366]RAJ55213.1 hypothetical protein K376_04746 [Streptomyces sp. PsTaAH-130]TXJ71522.1 hypothetical protein E2C11_32405 [Streptomyces lavendulae]